MARECHAYTLFHLVPLNQVAYEALDHPDNRRFITASSDNKKSLGLEVGFHVPSILGGRVIVRLGREADLSLRGREMSKVQITFEFHPLTLLVLVSVRARDGGSVKVAASVAGQDPKPEAPREMGDDCALVYGQGYFIDISSHKFELVWRKETHENAEVLRERTIQGYNSLRRLPNIRSCDRPTEYLNEENFRTWHHTWLQAPNARVRELEEDPQPHSPRILGRGAFGEVYKAIDAGTGNPFAVKVILLKYEEAQRSTVQKEIEIMAKVKHENIVEFMGYDYSNTLKPKLFMALCTGSLRELANEQQRELRADAVSWQWQALEQMLRALDYLTTLNLCHRDVKPENILYNEGGTSGRYRFQLADFGLAKNLDLARGRTYCGTHWYLAPELLFTEDQNPKMDVLSLFATMLDVLPAYDFPPRATCSVSQVHKIVQDFAKEPGETSYLKPMAAFNPDDRASAAQMLVALFEGRGLTTPRTEVPELKLQLITPGDSAPDGQQPGETWAPAQQPLEVPELIESKRHDLKVVRRGMMARAPGNPNRVVKPELKRGRPVSRSQEPKW